MFKATITFDDPDLAKVLEAEDNIDMARSTASVKKGSITIEAKDIIALKATVNGYLKIMEAYDKASSSISVR
ncbi:hypothetical protein H6503_02565 [Candidatus Woesearchaeota archaeon]|nr:hypothetical protein [Candidatus Woesearchaeota archaeon]